MLNIISSLKINSITLDLDKKYSNLQQVLQSIDFDRFQLVNRLNAEEKQYIRDVNFIDYNSNDYNSKDVDKQLGLEEQILHSIRNATKLAINESVNALKKL